MKRKALLLPYNHQGQLFIQDRTNYKLPPWGFFGGSIESGETPIEAVIREAKEELDLDLAATDLINIGNLPTIYYGEPVERNFSCIKPNKLISPCSKVVAENGSMLTRLSSISSQKIIYQNY
jgi:8-oxo-dGTP pyrophosphatase MutT (NUDIX family)